MKVFVLLFAALMTINFVSAQSSPDALRIQKEAKQFLDSLLASYTSEGNSYKSGVSSYASTYYNAFNNARRLTGEKLRTLSIDSQSIASKYISEINFFIFQLQTEFSAQSIELRLQKVRLALDAQYINRIQSDIETLALVVDFNPAAAECWDLNKGVLRALFDSAVQQFQYVYRIDVDSLRFQINDISALINNEVTRIDKDAETNCPNRGTSCLIKYYTKKQAAILQTLGKFRDIALNGLKNDILAGTAAKGIDVVKRSFENYQDYKSSVENCIATHVTRYTTQRITTQPH